MSDKLTDYRAVKEPLPEENVIWPLYGAGIDNLGQDGGTLTRSMPECGPDQLIVRHDACGICFSDVKILRLGPEHPRIYRDMKTRPVVMGHEVAMTIVKVGDQLKDKYHVGDRFTIQADIITGGLGVAYGYEMDGGFSKYGLVDQRVLNGDEGNYLLPVTDDTGVVESALVEPWACVVAAYRLEYRTALKAGGTTWIIGADANDHRPYT
ncbi:MAG: alcohol dehydrogenase catalytic domain-containing protein, partial [Anaerolineae bacterium]|nr:alcohol dehydrogenase catalytic domain-containing protein [Anaerolineae bacterium]